MTNTDIYILTDCNRAYLHVALSNRANNAANPCKSLSGFFVDSCSEVSRVVYHESLPSEEMALKRFQELSRYTRMQKERLIRKHNPNWVDLIRHISKSLSFSTRSPFRTKSSAPRVAGFASWHSCTPEFNQITTNRVQN